ncbi:metal-binding protein SmbP [Methylomonas paludis]|uniref:Metal-binding protein SmbP n=1 Tax=Methylomonas paludis TaxID=1173101 RepID=A0A975R9X5_9GAMM|nr:small metal-binding protein SmbP [Methylomonas paludis]QWF71537.1 metal-binding protein SmbP [Methylomonas paludis]
MSRIIYLVSFLLLAVSSGVFAEPHADAALEATNKAVLHGKSGHVSLLVEYAQTALEQAKQGAAVAKDEAKIHMDAAVKSLDETIQHGKTGHVAIATKSAEAAVTHLQEGNK